MDFYLKDSKTNEQSLVEVKGVTLFQENIALFPDAPTIRGTRHINELIKAKNEKFDAIIIFVIMSKDVQVFKPYKRMDPDFSKKLLEAEEAGVQIMPYRVVPEVKENSLYFHFDSTIEYSF